ncbi:hypothetical protein BJ165DRAFT_1407914 [Panaeolus papilionaceus]|nr:hypothetical protein BJ165DRAFT_1407914 [Panaeolus papilionaceus]
MGRVAAVFLACALAIQLFFFINADGNYPQVGCNAWGTTRNAYHRYDPYARAPSRWNRSIRRNPGMNGNKISVGKISRLPACFYEEQGQDSEGGKEVSKWSIGSIAWGKSNDCWYRAKTGNWTQRPDSNNRWHPMIIIGLVDAACEVLVCSHYLPLDLDTKAQDVNTYCIRSGGFFDDTMGIVNNLPETIATRVALGTTFLIPTTLLVATDAQRAPTLPEKLHYSDLQALWNDVRYLRNQY